MSHYDDHTSSRAYQENVALPDQRAFAREAEARRQAAVKIEQHKALYRCVHEEERYRIPQAIAVGLDSGLQVMVDLCPNCLHNLNDLRRAQHG